MSSEFPSRDEKPVMHHQIKPSKWHNDSIIHLLNQLCSTWSQDIWWSGFDCREKQAWHDSPFLTTMLAIISLGLALWSFLSKKRLCAKLGPGLRKFHVTKTKANTLSCYLGKSITWKLPCVWMWCVFSLAGGFPLYMRWLTCSLWRLVIVGQCLGQLSE